MGLEVSDEVTLIPNSHLCHYLLHTEKRGLQ